MKKLITIFFSVMCLCFSVFAAASPPGTSSAKAFDLQNGKDGVIYADRVIPARTLEKFTSGETQNYSVFITTAEQNHAYLAAAENRHINDAVFFGLAKTFNPTKHGMPLLCFQLPRPDAFKGFGADNKARAKI